MLQELAEEEEQYSLAFRSQLELISHLDQVYGSRMMELLSRHQAGTALELKSNAVEGATMDQV